jgi:copper chaperone CopZ
MITRLSIPGMRSNYCVTAVFTALTAVEGITRADVAIGAATIEHDGRATADALRSAIAVAGYEVAEVVEERRRLVYEPTASPRIWRRWCSRWAT